MTENAHSIIISNGRIVTPDGIVDGDLLITGETITRIGGSITEPDARIINANGGWVLAGGIDVHTHFNLDVGIAVAQDDFYTGTVAAAFGGTTTVVDHPGFGPDQCSLFHQIRLYHGYASGKAVIDYSFHGVLQHLDDTVLSEISKLADHGITSMKAYMTYDRRFTGGMLKTVLEAARDAGVVLAVHAEDHEPIQVLRRRYTGQGRIAPINHARTRPPVTEGEAVRQAIEIAGDAGNAPLYIVHLSTRDGLAHVAAARKAGRNVFAETCPQYLLLDESRYDGPDGLKYVMSPPLRQPEHAETLWNGLASGDIMVLATDHCPFDFTLKQGLAGHDFSLCPGGSPGVEARVPLIFGAAVADRGMEMTHFSKLISENPARLMGLYPKKGVIREGSDADLIIMTPGETTITHGLLHENVDHTPYEGFRVPAWPSMTMVRGRVVVQDGTLLAEPGYGEFIPRKKFGTQRHHAGETKLK